ncbi:hypothetical protein C2E23DRAFT_715947, partial [Lenzites betulinus]
SVFERFLLGAPNVVVDRFFSSWTPDLIMRLRAVNSNMFLGVESYISRAWNIERSLERWFFHVGAFLRMLDLCEGVVSGSEAQQHFGRHEYRGNDLDIYLPYHGVLRMGRWLKQQAFVYQPSGNKHIFFDAAAIMLASAAGRGFEGYSGSRHAAASTVSTFNFVRPLDKAHQSLGMDGAHIQLIVVSQDPVQFIVENFHSTGVMNYITGQHAVSLFPHATFVDHQMLVCQDTTQNRPIHEGWMAKYRKRGFTIIEGTNDPPCTPEFREWMRHVGDCRTWVLPHERSGMSSVLICASTIDIWACRLVPSKRQSPPLKTAHFEVMPSYSGVASSGAALRVGPRFVYRCVVFV